MWTFIRMWASLVSLLCLSVVSFHPSSETLERVFAVCYVFGFAKFLFLPLSPCPCVLLLLILICLGPLPNPTQLSLVPQVCLMEWLVLYKHVNLDKWQWILDTLCVCWSMFQFTVVFFTVTVLVLVTLLIKKKKEEDKKRKLILCV